MRHLKWILLTFAALALAVLLPSPAHAWCTPRILHCGDEIDSTTVQGHDDVSRYNCTGDTRFNGKAHVYKITHPGDSLWLRLDWVGDADHELGLFVLSACDRNTCLAYNSHDLKLRLNPGQYWIIVDSRTDVGTGYKLQIFCGDVPLPVELISFSARRVAAGVELSWSTASETDNTGFFIERQDENSEVWDRIGSVRGQGTTSAQSDYVFTDPTARADGTYAYRLFAVDINGAERELSLLVVGHGEAATELPSAFRLLGSYPNPFNPRTRIAFETAAEEPMTLDVFDISGRHVRTLASGIFASGLHEVEFDANGLPSGVYLIRLSGSFPTQLQKVMLLK